MISSSVGDVGLLLSFQSSVGDSENLSFGVVQLDADRPPVLV